MSHPPRPGFGLAVGITGHRPPLLDAAAAERAAPRLREALVALAEAAARIHAAEARYFADAPPSLRFVTPLAEGADQLAAELALAAGYRVEAVLPLPRDDYRRDFTDNASDNAFDALLDRAGCALELPALPAGRPASYALAGRAVLAHSDVLVALWDGAPGRGIGGTADLVARALRQGLPVIHVPLDGGATVIRWAGYDPLANPDSFDQMPARTFDPAAADALVVQLLAPPAAPVERACLDRFLGETERRVRARVEYPALLAVLGIKRLRRATFRSGPYDADTRREWERFRTFCRDGAHGVRPRLDSIEAAYGWSDRLAQHFAQSYRSGHVLNFLLGAAAVLLALSGLLFKELKFWLALCELAAVAGFVLNTRVGIAREWHRRWLDYRQLAERLRPMRSLKLLGVGRPAVRPGAEREPRWLDWYAAAVWRASGCASGCLSDRRAVAAFIAEEELCPQLAYHRAAAHQLHLLDHRLHRIGMWLFLASLLSCLVFLVGYVAAHAWVRANAGVFVALSAGLPALGAAIFGIRVQGDFGASAARSSATAADLARYVDALEANGDDLPRVVDLVEGAAATMLADLSDWRQAYERRQLELP
ncbi:hypothetical protein KZ820_06210 [Sphingomonas sp. RRHST34]|uniref:DUF4231 domain-containing protein n=1 Tax=Sphingomonas citri TaxID=2862499 RepID=A0ABS7BL36_9SPHN|nr:hypothetical protein [Sphingomonas citri]MBW6530325.1 hypothetical protein [Sphingomonas citri]